MANGRGYRCITAIAVRSVFVNILKRLGWIPVLVAATLISCEKQDNPPEQLGAKYDTAHFKIGSLGEKVLIEIEGWNTGYLHFDNFIWDTPAYLTVDPNYSGTIYYRKYVVQALVDSKWEYVGWGYVVSDTTFVDREHLNK